MKSRTRTQHLTDAEFGDLLAGGLPDEITKAHLAACEHCRGEFEAVQDSLLSFQGMSRRWSEVAAPSRVPVPSRWALGQVLRPNLATGLAVTALTGVFAFLHAAPAARTAPTTGVTAAIAAPAPTNAELADDKRLMVSIDQELGYQSQGSGAPNLQSTAHDVAAGSPSTVLN